MGGSKRSADAAGPLGNSVGTRRAEICSLLLRTNCSSVYNLPTLLNNLWSPTLGETLATGAGHEEDAPVESQTQEEWR